MDRSTFRNLAILGLIQIGILVGDVLAATVVARWWGTHEPWPCRLLASFGCLGLLLPVVWLGLAVGVFVRCGESDRAKMSIVAAGVLLIVLLLLAGWFGAAWPWLQLINGVELQN